MPPRAAGPSPCLESEPSAADPARLRDPPQSAPVAPLPARRRAAETATRTDQSRSLPRPKTGSGGGPDQQISPGRMTGTMFSERRVGCPTSWQGLGENERGDWELIGRQYDG